MPYRAGRSLLVWGRHRLHWSSKHPPVSVSVRPEALLRFHNDGQRYWEILSRWQSFPWSVKEVPQSPNIRLFRLGSDRLSWQTYHAGCARTHAGMSPLRWKLAKQVCFRSAWWSSSLQIYAVGCLHRLRDLSIVPCNWSSRLRRVFRDGDGSQCTIQTGTCRLCRIPRRLQHLCDKPGFPYFSGKWFRRVFLPVRILLFLLVPVRSKDGAFLHWYWISCFSVYWNSSSSPRAWQWSHHLVPHVPVPVLRDILSVRWECRLPITGWAAYIRHRCFQPFVFWGYIPHNLYILVAGLFSCVY